MPADKRAQVQDIIIQALEVNWFDAKVSLIHAVMKGDFTVPEFYQISLEHQWMSEEDLNKLVLASITPTK